MIAYDPIPGRFSCYDQLGDRTIDMMRAGEVAGTEQELSDDLAAGKTESGSEQRNPR